MSFGEGDLGRVVGSVFLGGVKLGCYASEIAGVLLISYGMNTRGDEQIMGNVFGAGLFFGGRIIGDLITRVSVVGRIYEENTRLVRELKEYIPNRERTE